tara:strand:+ start:283 stop:675 length:393 start_codon:yes stop_codon:yes gene_type:complete
LVFDLKVYKNICKQQHIQQATHACDAWNRSQSTPRNPGPDEPDNHAEQHPREKCTQHNDGDKHDQQTDSATLDQRLTFVSHILPTGDQRHGICATATINLGDTLEGHHSQTYVVHSSNNLLLTHQYTISG